MKEFIIVFVNEHPILFVLCFILLCNIIAQLILVLDCLVYHAIGKKCSYENIVDSFESDSDFFDVFYQFGLVLYGLPSYALCCLIESLLGRVSKSTKKFMRLMNFWLSKD